MDQQAAVRDLQHMLNQLGLRNPNLPRLAETGIFDELTLEAVMIFQRDFFPPVTGVVDNGTWDAIVEAYKKDQLHYGPPIQLRVLPHGEFSTSPGGQSEPVLVAQAMFEAFPASLADFSGGGLDGFNTGTTTENLRTVQRISGLPVNGAFNRATWEYLARLYHVFVTRNALGK